MSIEPLPVVRLAHIPPRPAARRWLVEGLWADEAVGCIGGTPKSGKTWLALELALAVATGRPCLGRFVVSNPGRVLLYAAEDSAQAIRERALGLARARGVDLEQAPIGLITEEGLRLDQRAHQQRLDATLARLQPRLLILDPLVRLHRADENSAAEMSALLGFLRQLNRQHHVAILLVHHVRKSGSSQPGQALRGSGDLHAWGDSNLYLLRNKEQVVLHAEHRSQPAPPALPLSLASDPPHLVPGEPAVLPPPPVDAVEARVLEALAQHPRTRTELREHLRIRNETLGAALGHLSADSRIQLKEGRWWLPVPASGDQRERNEAPSSERPTGTPLRASRPAEGVPAPRRT